MKNIMKRLQVFIILSLTVCMLSGCVSSSAEITSEFDDVEEIDSLDTESEEEVFEESEEVSEESEEEPVSVEYVEWDGTGTIRKNDAVRLGRMQYYQGKTYVIDRDNSVLGEPFPTVPRKEGDKLVEPKITFFLFAEDTLFYMEKKDIGIPWLSSRQCCCNLYAQSLESGEVRLLAEDLAGGSIYYETADAVYHEGIITYEVYREELDTGYDEDLTIKQIDSDTGEILNEVNFGKSVYAINYNKDYLYYYDREAEKDFYYYFRDGSRKEVVFAPEIGYTYHEDGNMYGEISSGDEKYKVVQLYEQGEEVARIFSYEFSGYTYHSHNKIFYEEDRKVMEYNLETGELRFICELGEDEYDPHDLSGIEENNGMIFLEEGGLGAPGGYGIIYLYEVQDGQKKFVTNGFWVDF